MINRRGQIFIITIIILTVVMVTTLLIISGAFQFNLSSRYSIEELQAISLAEAGIDKAVASLNTGSSYIGEETILGKGVYKVSIYSQDGGKTVESTGYIPDKTNPKVKRTVKVKVASGVGASFIYGIQVGEGGLELGNNNQVLGSIYSNGSVTMHNNNSITGDVFIASGPQTSADQQTDCSGASCSDYLFGKDVNGEDRLDLAQSFKPQVTAVLNKVSIKLRKIGNPPDATVRIIKDKNDSPDKTAVVTSGTLFSNLVSTNYGWIDVAFDSTPVLVADEPYWIVFDSSLNLGYWSWQADNLQSYSRGAPAYSSDWQAKNPVWAVVPSDLSFEVFMGGQVTKLIGESHDTVLGDAHANTISGMTIGRDAYYQTISNSTVAGKSYPGSGDPPPKVFPISEANINDWKDEAQSAGVYGLVNSCVDTLGPGKYGDVTFSNKCQVNVKSPIWITGDLNLNNENILTLDQSYGASSGVIIVDGKINLSNKNKLQGTGQGSSMLLALSAYDSRTSGIAAVKVQNEGNSGVFYAKDGIIEPGNNNSFKELTAWGIRLTNNSVIDYEIGLSSTLFSSGPSGSYTVVKGSYQIR